MSCLGVHFALSEADVVAIQEIDDEQGRLAHVQEVLEEDYFANHQDLIAQSDKAWMRCTVLSPTANSAGTAVHTLSTM